MRAIPAISPDGDLSRRGFLSAAASGVLLAAPARMNVPSEYPLVVAKGSHRELGRQHGEQASGKIHAHLDFIASEARLSRESLRARDTRHAGQPSADRRRARRRRANRRNGDRRR